MRIVLVEGGLTALSLAYDLKKRGHEVLVFHRSAQIETSLATQRVGNLHMEFGVPFFLKADTHSLQAVQKLHLDNFMEEHSPSFGIFWKGELVPLSPPLRAPLPYFFNWLSKRPFRWQQLLAPHFGSPPPPRWVRSFFQEPHLRLRYGMDFLLDRLIAEGHFFLEAAVVHFQRNPELGKITHAIVTALGSRHHTTVSADLFFVGAPFAFPYTVSCTLSSNRPPFDYIFFTSSRELPMEGALLVENSSSFSSSPFVLRFTVCTDKTSEAERAIQTFCEQLDLELQGELQFAPPPPPQDLPNLEPSRNLIQIPPAKRAEEELRHASSLLAELTANGL